MNENHTECETVDNNYRLYNEAPIQVKQFYWNQHTELTYKVAYKLNDRFQFSDKRNYTIDELLHICDDIFDPSDPDTSLSQTEHAYQTAYSALQQGLADEYVVLGLIHDLGKAVVKLLGIDMTFLVGDTYPLGCPFQVEHITLGESLLQNPDASNPSYNQGYGCYHSHCGFERMIFTGHDEFIYLSLCASKHNLPEWALYAVRYHSFYPWHHHQAYAEYANDKDHEYLPYLKQLNKLDLYTKHDKPVDASSRQRIDDIVKQYIPNGLMFPSV